MFPLYNEKHFTFRFADDRIIPRFHLEGVKSGQRISVLSINPETEERLRLIAAATVGEGGWVDLDEPIIVRAGDAFIALPEQEPSLAERRAMSNDPDWNYEPVRRLLESIEEALSESIRWATFEANDETTWSRARQVVAEYLISRWRDGALLGTKLQDAFFVRCDRSTMTQDDIDAGRLVCLVGVAPIKPAEFVIISIMQITAARI